MLPPRRLAVLATVLAAASLGACGGDDNGDEERTATGTTASEAQFSRPEKVLKRGTKATATVSTSQGAFEIELDTRLAPKTTNSFAFLAQEGFYDGTTFHRIVPGFVVQGGDPTGTGTGGPGYEIDEPPPPDTEYLRGTVAMANVPGVDPPGRSGSQFFVVVAADAGLPPTSPLLGDVSSGFGVIERIAALGDPASGQTGTPLETVTISSVAIKRR
jgi:cyclophilin family peptidyl-prolyl cis-trans isomerase